MNILNGLTAIAAVLVAWGLICQDWCYVGISVIFVCVVLFAHSFEFNDWKEQRDGIKGKIKERLKQIAEKL